MTHRLPTYFISHGGGPWPYMPEMRSQMQVLATALADMPRQLGITPKAILMVSAHWEEAAFTVMTSSQPPMVYDYSGFPPHTYSVVYTDPGDPDLAYRVQSLLEAAQLPTAQDSRRGFDHGAFAPLAVMYPQAQIPVVQLSLKRGLDPAEHLAAGRALAPLRDEGILIVGSGLSYHNLRQFGPPARAPSQAFDAWLQTALAAHLLPLMVALGAAHADPATCVYHEDNIFGGVTASSFRWDAVAAH
ncbi:MAG: dioxygenase [Burkholderiales bacterium PBB4]|nr:MAG: dioxygenase [Burkholderiales bacterium PBB4]